jgi:HlyD family secretion protein
LMLRPRQKGRWWILVLGAGLALGGGLWFMGMTASAGWTMRTVAAGPGRIQTQVEAGGTVRPVTTVTVGSQVSGLTVEVPVEAGDVVKAGQLLVRLDPAQLDLEVAQAQAALHTAAASVSQAAVAVERAEMIQQRRTSAQGSFSPQDLALAALDVRAAESSLASARAELARAAAAASRAEDNRRRSEIRAPLSGTVLSVAAEVGRTVAANFQAPELVTMAADLRQLRVEVDVPEVDFSRWKPGAQADISVDAHPGRTWTGLVRVLRPQPRTVSNVTTYTALVEVDNHDGTLLPGLSATVRVVIADRQAAITVPSSALRLRLPELLEPEVPVGRRLLWVAEQGMPKPRIVTVGTMAGGVAEITEGLVAGEPVVVQAISPRGPAPVGLP